MKKLLLPLCLLLVTSTVQAEDAGIWIQKARAQGLAQSPAWLKLLHIQRNIWGVRQSDIDDPAFFLSPRGRRDPQAELDVTLTAFFDTNASTEPAQCRYPARYA